MRYFNPGSRKGRKRDEVLEIQFELGVRSVAYHVKGKDGVIRLVSLPSVYATNKGWVQVRYLEALSNEFGPVSL